jgi:NAD kinase
MTLSPRAVVVFRQTELETLVAHHGTRQQAAFFLESRGRDPDQLVAADDAQRAALQHVAASIPIDWRRVQVERADLSRFVFGGEDIVIAVGQDGLVANVAKYLDGQVVIGLNPEPDRNPGVLVPHHPQAVGGLLDVALSPQVEARVEPRTMVLAQLDDGQELRGLNEVYLGHPSHQSARYTLTTVDGTSERQSSSGVLVGTGTGATGWCRSVALERRSEMQPPGPTQAGLCWYTREAWPSPATGTAHTQGTVGPGQVFAVTAESDLVAFADGIETDALHLTWGQRVTFTVAPGRLRLLR